MPRARACAVAYRAGVIVGAMDIDIVHDESERLRGVLTWRGRRGVRTREWGGERRFKIDAIIGKGGSGSVEGGEARVDPAEGAPPFATKGSCAGGIWMCVFCDDAKRGRSRMCGVGS
jgi:hypothetical protein